MRADLRGLADDGQVEEVDPPAALADPRGCKGEELGRCRAAPLRIARREMRADIAVGERAEQGIGQGVERDVAIGMGDDALIMSDPDATKPDMVAGTEGMDIVAGADSRHEGPAGVSRGPQEIRGMGQLHISRVALEGRDRVTGPLHQGGIVGEAVQQGCLRSFMGVEQRPEAESLRRLDGDELVARRGFGDMAVGAGALHGVGYGQGGDGGDRTGAKPVDGRADLCARDKGPGRVVDEHDAVEALAGKRKQAAPHRGLARRAAERRGRKPGAVDAGHGIGVARLVALADHDGDARDRGLRQKGRQRMGENGTPLDEAILLRLAIAGPQSAASRDEQGSDGLGRIGVTEHGAGFWLQAGHGRMA